MKKKKSKKPKHPKIIQLVEYGISGGAYFWTGYLAFFVADKGLHWNLLAAKLSADVIGWTVNYLMQRYWVFNNTKLNKHQDEVTTRYVIITLTDFLLDYGIIWYLKRIGITPYIGQFVSAAFFTGWNYLWYRFWVFPDRYPTKRKRMA